MLRNKEIKKLLVFCFILGSIGVISILMIDFLAGLIAFFLYIGLCSAFIVFTKKRYQDIKHLSEYLSNVYTGRKHMDIRDNKEGELSILKNDIYKVTLTLYKQSELLKKDKKYLSDTLSNISHQLKTPLTSMFVMTDLLSDPNLPMDKKEEFLNNLTNQLKRIEWLVSSLLKLAKIDADAVTFKKDKIQLSTLIAKALEPLLIPAELKNQQLIIECREDIYVQVDFNWTVEAFINIIKNCIEHTKPNGIIKITGSHNPLYTEVIIEDNGEGIDPADKPYIFERFYKGKNAGPDSIGIGLAMSKTILLSQNASLSLDNHHTNNHNTIGTKFIITFYSQNP